MAFYKRCGISKAETWRAHFICLFTVESYWICKMHNTFWL